MAEACRLQKDFYVDSNIHEGVADLLEYLREEGDIMPWERGKMESQ